MRYPSNINLLKITVALSGLLIAMIVSSFILTSILAYNLLWNGIECTVTDTAK